MCGCVRTCQCVSVSRVRLPDLKWGPRWLAAEGPPHQSNQSIEGGLGLVSNQPQCNGKGPPVRLLRSVRHAVQQLVPHSAARPPKCSHAAALTTTRPLSCCHRRRCMCGPSPRQLGSPHASWVQPAKLPVALTSTKPPKPRHRFCAAGRSTLLADPRQAPRASADCAAGRPRGVCGDLGPAQLAAQSARAHPLSPQPQEGEERPAKRHSRPRPRLAQANPTCRPRTCANPPTVPHSRTPRFERPAHGLGGPIQRLRRLEGEHSSLEANERQWPRFRSPPLLSPRLPGRAGAGFNPGCSRRRGHLCIAGLLHGFTYNPTSTKRTPLATTCSVKSRMDGLAGCGEATGHRDSVGAIESIGSTQDSRGSRLKSFQSADLFQLYDESIDRLSTRTHSEVDRHLGDRRSLAPQSAL